MKFKVYIPARYASSRLPGKPLLLVGGKPIVQHVYENARSSAAEDVVIATDDDRIDKAARGFGAAVTRTQSTHHSGTDRIAEPTTGTAALQFGSTLAALTTAVAIAAFIASWAGIPAEMDGQAYFEFLFWGGGHVLQFTHTL